jgi:hypothetical protein
VIRSDGIVPLYVECSRELLACCYEARTFDAPGAPRNSWGVGESGVHFMPAIDAWAFAEALAQDLYGDLCAEEDWANAPFVCPGCYAVNEPCAPGCIDAEIEAEHRDALLYGNRDDHFDEEE